MTLRYLATTANGRLVYVDIDSSHAATHLADTTELRTLVRELLAQLAPIEKDVYVDRDMGRIVGLTDRVETTARDEIIYAKRPNRDNYTRFVKGREPQPTRFVTVALREISEPEGYELRSAWIGRASPMFPGDNFDSPASWTFWRQHALIWGRQTIQPGTEISDWPWG